MVGRKVKRLGDIWMGSNGVCLNSIRDLYIPRNGQDTCDLSLVRIFGHHDYHRPRHHGPFDDSFDLTSARTASIRLHHSFVLLFFDHAIVFLVLLTIYFYSSYSHTTRSESRPT